MNLVLGHLLLEALVELIHIDSAFFLLRCVHRDIECRVDGHLAGQPVLIVQTVEGHAGDGRVWIALLVRRVGNQRGQVLFQLGQVGRDVALGEVCVLVIRHRGRHASREPTILEVEGQVLAEQLQLLKLRLLVIDLHSVSHDAFAQLLITTRELADLGSQIVLIQAIELLVEGDLLIIVGS